MLKRWCIALFAFQSVNSCHFKHSHQVFTTESSIITSWWTTTGNMARFSRKEHFLERECICLIRIISKSITRRKGSPHTPHASLRQMLCTRNTGVRPLDWEMCELYVFVFCSMLKKKSNASAPMHSPVFLFSHMSIA